MKEQKAVQEEKPKEEQRRPCEKCLSRVTMVAGEHKASYCSRFSQVIDEDRETCIGTERENERKQYKEFSEYLKEGEQKYGDNFLPPEGYTNGKERKIMERFDLLERYLGISKHKMKQTVATLFVEQDKRLAKIEERLTEIEGVLTSIGSPDYDLRKKVEALEIQAKHIANYIPNVSYELKDN